MMRLGIRGKMAGALLIAGLAPLAISLVVGLLAYRDTRRELVGQSFRAMARQQADVLATLLSSEIELLQTLNQLPPTGEFLEQANVVPPISHEQIQAIEARWPTLDENDPLLHQILHNELSRRWRTVQENHHRISEMMLTDRVGRLVAATNKTSDYFQADEPWWKHAIAETRGRVCLDDVGFDDSAISETGQVGAFVADLCLPIYPGRRPTPGEEPLGVMKVSLDADWLLRQLRDVRSEASGAPRHVWLIGRDGRPIQPGRDPAFEQIPQALLKSIVGVRDGYLISPELPDHEVIGFSHVNLPGRIGRTAEWYVVITAPRDEALAATRRLLWTLGTAGGVIIVLCFIAGWRIAQREILRPLLGLARGARELEQGHLDYRLIPPGEEGSVFRRDELGRLARDFNRMAAQFERSVDALDRANRVKQQFIDVASHELRTPVTYILGVTELAQRRDGQSPVLAKIAAKAQRLNRIVGNMFKLLRSGAYETLPHPVDVNLEQLIRSVAAETEPFLAARRQKLDLKLPAGVPHIPGDAEMLRDILDNLLSNAVRFSPDDSTITIQLVDRPDDVEIVVADEGKGIAPEHLERVFEPFYTEGMDVTHHSSGEYQYMTHGIGLGLSVVKRFVDLHGGRVHIESSERGTRVHIILPKRTVAPLPADV